MLQMYIKYYYLQIIWRFFFLNVLEKNYWPTHMNETDNSLFIFLFLTKE